MDPKPAFYKDKAGISISWLKKKKKNKKNLSIEPETGNYQISPPKSRWVWKRNFLFKGRRKWNKAAAIFHHFKTNTKETRGFDIGNSIKEACAVSELILLTHKTACLLFGSVSGQRTWDLTQRNCQFIVTLTGNPSAEREIHWALM